jgi:hypothetical protein
VKTIGVIQSGYIPWRGYFDFINEVDVFVFLDDVQYTKRDWRSRNRIRTRDGSSWLTVPVLGGRDQLIEDVRIDYAQRWVSRHLDTIRHNYGKTGFFEPLFSELTRILQQQVEHLSRLNQSLIGCICDMTGISTPRMVSGELGIPGEKEEKLLGIVTALEGDVYLSGPSAASYLVPSNWEQAGIELRFKEYDGYPSYPQITGPFEANVSIIDAIFMQGTDLQTIMGHRPETRPA